MPKKITSVLWQASNIPPGLAFDTRTGIFSGTPTTADDYTVPVTVKTNYGTDTKDVAISIDKKGDWKEMTGPNGIILRDCIDDGEKIIFFGQPITDYDGTSNYRDTANGVFCTYNPNTSTYSDIYNLIDGEKYAGKDESLESYAYSFKACSQDPVSKKWLAFFGTHYIRTPTSIKDLGSDVDFSYITTCWANNLQKFCVIGASSSKSYTSYLFDIDGNLVAKSTDINSISDFNLYSGSNKGRSWDMRICWSDTENKFVVICDATSIAAYSSDGLNWTGVKLTGGLSYTSRIICRAESLGLFIASSGYTTGSGTTATGRANIFTSPDGLTWTKIKTFSNICPHKIAWSESKQTLCLVGSYLNSYISTNLTDWENISAPSTVTDYGGLIWSDTANAFIAPQGLTNKFIRLKV